MNNNGQKKTKLNVKAQIPQKEPSNGGRATIVMAQKLATLFWYFLPVADAHVRQMMVL
jgi:hypothetical protein